MIKWSPAPRNEMQSVAMAIGSEAGHSLLGVGTWVTLHSGPEVQAWITPPVLMRKVRPSRQGPGRMEFLPLCVEIPANCVCVYEDREEKRKGDGY